MIISSAMVFKTLVRQCETTHSPEAQLLLAIIRAALVDLHTKRYHEGCIKFFDGEWFETICDLLGLGVDAARESIAMIGQRVDVDVRLLDARS